MSLLIIWLIFLLFSKPNVCQVAAQCVKNFIKNEKVGKKRGQKTGKRKARRIICHLKKL
jgi:hypothetical protein